MKVQPLTLRNALVWNGKEAVRHDLHTSDVVLDKPHPHAFTVDLSGYTIFPGLINAHDHLELNHYPRSKFRERYDNAHQWGEDMNARLNDSPYRELRAYPLEDRLFIGGLKNLLCGALTVAHHNPPHKPLFRKDFPVRVLRKYGWAHSLHFSSDEEIVRSYRSTPPNAPWFIHLAEGTDDVAAGEYRRLKALGCVGKNTVIVHGVGLSRNDSWDARMQGARLVICPSTNLYLLGRVPLYEAELHHDVMLGSDSRLTADGDLLDELRIFHKLFPDFRHPIHTVTLSPERRFGLRPDRSNAFDGGQYSDFIIFRDEYESVQPYPVHARRANLALIMRGGIPQIGDPEVMAKFPHVETVEATLDGIPKLVNVQLARQIAQCSLKEPGLELLEKPKARMFTFR
jgi:hypothetical protein